MTSHDACLLFDVRGLDDFTRAHFDLIEREVRGTCDAYVVPHVASKGEGDPDLAGRTVELDDRDIFEGLRHRKDVLRGLVPGNCDLKFLAAARALPRYRRIVWWEYDVVCTRDVGDSVRRLLSETEGHDFAGSYVSEYDGDDWMWWRSFRAPAPTVRHRAFVPLFVASRAFVDGYAGLLSAGWRGHSEVTLPTAANHLGLSTVDISRLQSDFTHWPQFSALAPAKMDERVPMFIHPVKGFEQLAAYDLPDCRLAGTRVGDARDPELADGVPSGDG